MTHDPMDRKMMQSAVSNAKHGNGTKKGLVKLRDLLTLTIKERRNPQSISDILLSILELNHCPLFCLLQGNKCYFFGSHCTAIDRFEGFIGECLKGEQTSCHQTKSVVVYQAISVASAHGISGSHKTSHTTQVGRCRHCGGGRKVEAAKSLCFHLGITWDRSSFLPETSVKGALQFVPIATNT